MNCLDTLLDLISPLARFARLSVGVLSADLLVVDPGTGIDVNEGHQLLPK